MVSLTNQALQNAQTRMWVHQARDVPVTSALSGGGGGMYPIYVCIHIYIYTQIDVYVYVYVYE